MTAPQPLLSSEEINAILAGEDPLKKDFIEPEQQEPPVEQPRPVVSPEEAVLPSTFEPDIQAFEEGLDLVLSNIISGIGGIPKVLKETPEFLFDLATDPETTVRKSFGLEPQPAPADTILGTERADAIRQAPLDLLDTILEKTGLPSRESIGDFFPKGQFLDRGPFDFDLPTSEEVGESLGLELKADEPISDTLLEAVRGGVEGSPFGIGGQLLFATAKGTDKALEELGFSPEERQVVQGGIGLLPFALGAIKPTLKAKPSPIETRKQAFEILKTDKQAQKNLRPKLDVIEAFDRTGNLDKVPAYLISDTALLEDSAINLKKSPLSKRRFNDQIKVLGEGLQETFDKTLNNVSKDQFETKFLAQEKLSKLNEAKKTASESVAFEIQNQISRLEENIEREGSAIENPIREMSSYLTNEPRIPRNRIGENVQTLIDRNVKTIRKSNRDAYQFADEIIPREEIIPLDLAFFVESELSKLDFEGAKSESTKKVIRQLKEFQNLIGTTEEPKPITVSDLIQQKVNFNDTLTYDIIGGPKEIIKGVNRKTKDAVDPFKKRNPEWGERFDFAEENFAKNEAIFGTDVITKIRKNKPEEVFTQFKDTSAFNNISESLIGEGGSDSIQSLKRERLIDAVGDKDFAADRLPELTEAQNEKIFQLQDVFSQDEMDVLSASRFGNEQINQRLLSKETILKTIQDSLIEVQKDGELNPLLIDMTKNEDGILRLRDALNGTEEGRGIMKSLERFTVENMFGDSLFDNNGNLDISKFQKSMNNRENVAVLKRIGGDKLVNDMKAVSKSLNSMEKFIKSNPNSSSIPFAFAVAQFFSGNTLKALRTLGLKQGGQVLFSKFLNNPDSIKTLVRFAKEKTPKGKTQILNELNDSFNRFAISEKSVQEE